MDKNWLHHLGKNLKERRQSKGLSQFDVARELGYTTPQFISNVERGLSPPPYEILPQLAKLYRMPEKEVNQLMRDVISLRVREVFMEYKKNKK